MRGRAHRGPSGRPAHAQEQRPDATAPPRRDRRGFSLIELAVVLIVIGVIAAIAIPTFQRVIGRAEEKALLTENQAVQRNVAALLAFDPDEHPYVALTIAWSETTAAAPGITAAEGSRTVLTTPSTEAAPNAAGVGTVSWALDADQLGWATTLGGDRGVKCRVSLTGAGHGCWASNTSPAGFLALDEDPDTTPTPDPATTPDPRRARRCSPPAT